MRVIDRAPSSWKLASLPLLLFCVLTSTAFGATPEQAAIPIGIAALVSLFTGWRLRQASQWVFWLVLATILAVGTWQTIQWVEQRNSFGALFTLGVMILAVPVGIQTHRENRRIYLVPGLKWYQGLPRSIPRVEADWEGLPFRVARINQEGAYLHTSSASAIRPSGGAITFRFRDQVIPCNVKVMSSFDRGSSGYGFGVRFERTSLAEAQRLNDWIERLRGEGYVE